ncbi:hypothetical protein [Sporosarcina pasteurii]|uniref:Uncharacterized protein n=1 Tax=Sporosarcina pasteurii TaxID=1474 RepID=A0A380C6S2_SPOPA|nr:hypothetical protein [Sporosarcina pasteurii]MDS9473076.1 hypothetical protein [Sporosarcina pasteurii]QBQ04581.1 hypothetical protein E2C16_02285 [Sporosarcina pasteurii]SUJ14008.1 Uncharacterised protein [Sporosarcina pasteurii]
MKFRAILLLALMIGGAYMMVQSFQDYEKKEFTDILHSMDAPFNSLIFTKPSVNGQGTDSWVVDEQEEIDTLLKFLQNYHVRKLKPEEINVYDDVNHFSISLLDDNGSELSIMLSEDLIIQDSILYYEVVDGPLDIDWLLAFFISNQ